MLFHLLYGTLGDKLGFLRVFGYTSTRVIAAAITALLLSFIIGPWFIERLKSRQDAFGDRTDDAGARMDEPSSRRAIGVSRTCSRARATARTRCEASA